MRRSSELLPWTFATNALEAKLRGAPVLHAVGVVGARAVDAAISAFVLKAQVSIDPNLDLLQDKLRQVQHPVACCRLRNPHYELPLVTKTAVFGALAHAAQGAV